MRALLSVVAILKDEAASVRRLLESAGPFADHITILDTGSSDGTRDIIREFYKENGGCEKADNYVGYRDHLFEQPVIPFAPLLACTPAKHVIDFAATRNVALELEAKREDKAVFTIFLSGDETLANGAELRAFLETQRDTDVEAFSVSMRQGTSMWPYTRILRVDSGWRYRYPIHEVPMNSDGTKSMGKLIPGVFVDYDSSDRPRYLERLKNIDLPVLTYLSEQKLETHDDHLSRARALLHLGMTHESLALEYDKDEPGSPWLLHQMTAMAHYWRRADLGGDPNEIGYSFFRYFDIASNIEGFFSHEELVARYSKLTEMDPNRPEVRYRLAVHASQFMEPVQAAALALASAKVAAAAKANPLPYTTDSRIEFASYAIAAECAGLMKNAKLAKSMAEKGIAAGGPPAMFAEYMAEG